MTKSNACRFSTVLCLIPENVYGRSYKKKQKKTGNGLAAGCQLLYYRIYGYFVQCAALVSVADPGQVFSMCLASFLRDLSTFEKTSYKHS